MLSYLCSLCSVLHIRLSSYVGKAFMTMITKSWSAIGLPGEGELFLAMYTITKMAMKFLSGKDKTNLDFICVVIYRATGS